MSKLMQQLTGLPKRLKRLQALMGEQGVDAILITSRTASLYLSGFPCSNSQLLIAQNEAIFFTDFRYLETAQAQIKHLQVVRMTQHGSSELSDTIHRLNISALGFEDTELSVAELKRYKKAITKAKWIPVSLMLRGLRAIKELDEIRQIAANQKLTQQLCQDALNYVEPGMQEIEVRKYLRRRMLDLNVEEAFDTIAAAGPHSSLPHAIPGTLRAKAGQYFLLDMGVKAKSYHSDLTRTIVLGKATTGRLREVYEVVLQAQMAALASIRAGIECRQVDSAARDVIRDAGYGDHFGHGTGHGVGLEIHEAPTLGPRSTDVLEAGMVVTVEPGIYLPGFGGVRIEDLVVVTDTGCRNLTSIDKSYQEKAIIRARN